MKYSRIWLIDLNPDMLYNIKLYKWHNKPIIYVLTQAAL